MSELRRSIGWIVGTTLVVGGALRLFVFDVWTVPEDKWLAASIAPTLGAGDTVLLLRHGKPGTGDLVRCADPEKAGKLVVGRIVGMPGDKVELGAARLTVNGHSFVSSEACTESTFTVTEPETGSAVKLNCSRIEMSGGWHFMGSRPKATSDRPHAHEVGPGRYYLASDNRGMHDDSRDFGAIPQATCNRRIVFRLWGAGGWLDGSRRFTVVR